MYTVIIKTEEKIGALTRKDAENHFGAVLEYAKEIGVTSMAIADVDGVVLREWPDGLMGGMK